MTPVRCRHCWRTVRVPDRWLWWCTDEACPACGSAITVIHRSVGYWLHHVLRAARAWVRRVWR